MHCALSTCATRTIGDSRYARDLLCTPGAKRPAAMRIHASTSQLSCRLVARILEKRLPLSSVIIFIFVCDSTFDLINRSRERHALCRSKPFSAGSRIFFFWTENFSNVIAQILFFRFGCEDCKVALLKHCDWKLCLFENHFEMTQGENPLRPVKHILLFLASFLEIGSGFFLTIGAETFNIILCCKGEKCAIFEKNRALPSHTGYDTFFQLR